MGLIDREAVLSLPRSVERTLDGKVVNETVDVKLIEALPTIEPRPKSHKVVKSNGRMGYWACDYCGEPLDKHDNFCPNCGADLREVTE